MVDEQHFHVTLRPTKCPTGVAGASIRGCMCCSRALCGMGGGGDYLCKSCLDKMITGEIAAAMYHYERNKDQ